MQPLNKCGSFLIRESESYADELSLSVRDTETVRHYRIMEDEVRRIFMTKQIFFRSIQDLLNFYSEDNHGMAVALKSVCCPQTADLQIDNVYDTLPYEAVYDCFKSFDHIVSYV